jgi:hypothetical protein
LPVKRDRRGSHAKETRAAAVEVDERLGNEKPAAWLSHLFKPSNAI